MPRIAISNTDVLIAVDLQNDFCPGGSLSVPRGHEVVPLINRLANHFEHIVLTQDWHLPDHLSFASAHPGKKPYETIVVGYGSQILWPDHCVQATRGAEFHVRPSGSRRVISPRASSVHRPCCRETGSRTRADCDGESIA